MTDDTTAITVNRVPAWLVQAVDDIAEKLDMSRSAAALALLAVGWHHATVDTTTVGTEPAEMKAFGDEFDVWRERGGESPIEGFTHEEWYIISRILPARPGGARDGAGRPPADE
jgi:predicted transcriptional regulator